MTTTYELYTNENGTPKAVEGKAPAILERVEALETSVETLEGTLDNGVVRSVNGTTADTDGNVVLTKQDIIDSLGYTPPTTDTKYTLPNATSSVLGGVKIGSNITVSSGTISMSKSNVTSALGYTPLKTAPVTSVNGKTGAVTIDISTVTTATNASCLNNIQMATVSSNTMKAPSGGTWACIGWYTERVSGDNTASGNFVAKIVSGGTKLASDYGSNNRVICFRKA